MGKKRSKKSAKKNQSECKNIQPDLLENDESQCQNIDINMMKRYIAESFVSVGASHLKANLPCQDSVISSMGSEYILIAVADGHGGEDYFRSQKGSAFAVEAFKRCIEKALISSEKTPPNENEKVWFINENTAANLNEKLLNSSEKAKGEAIQWLCRSICATWHELVNGDLKENPLEDSELTGLSDASRVRYMQHEHDERAYGTTLLGALMTRDFCLLVQIGDGVCAVIDLNDAVSEPVPSDDRCFLNKTTSLCDSNAQFEFRYRLLKDCPRAVFLTSDGAENSFQQRDSMYGFFRTIQNSFLEMPKEHAAAELREFLPRLSELGSGDDMSVAFILNTESVCKSSDSV